MASKRKRDQDVMSSLPSDNEDTNNNKEMKETPKTPDHFKLLEKEAEQRKRNADKKKCGAKQTFALVNTKDKERPLLLVRDDLLRFNNGSDLNTKIIYPSQTTISKNAKKRSNNMSVAENASRLEKSAFDIMQVGIRVVFFFKNNT